MTFLRFWLKQKLAHLKHRVEVPPLHDTSFTDEHREFEESLDQAQKILQQAQEQFQTKFDTIRMRLFMAEEALRVTQNHHHQVVEEMIDAEEARDRDRDTLPEQLDLFSHSPQESLPLNREDRSEGDTVH